MITLPGKTATVAGATLTVTPTLLVVESPLGSVIVTVKV